MEIISAAILSDGLRTWAATTVFCNAGSNSETPLLVPSRNSSAANFVRRPPSLACFLGVQETSKWPEIVWKAEMVGADGQKCLVKGATPHAVYLALRPFLLSSEVFLSQKPKGQFSSQSETFAFSSAHVQLFTLTKLTQTKSLTTHHHHTRNNHSNHDPLRHLTRITDANE